MNDPDIRWAITQALISKHKQDHGTCGDCHKWMTKSCPREHNINGRKNWPSCDDMVCDVFVHSPSYSTAPKETPQ